MSDEPLRTTDKKCPKCGSEEYAWVSSDAGDYMFECRQCRALFVYHGVL